MIFVLFSAKKTLANFVVCPCGCGPYDCRTSDHHTYICLHWLFFISALREGLCERLSLYCYILSGNLEAIPHQKWLIWEDFTG